MFLLNLFKGSKKKQGEENVVTASKEQLLPLNSEQIEAFDKKDVNKSGLPPLGKGIQNLLSPGGYIKTAITNGDNNAPSSQQDLVLTELSHASEKRKKGMSKFINDAKSDADIMDNDSIKFPLIPTPDMLGRNLI